MQQRWIFSFLTIVYICLNNSSTNNFFLFPVHFVRNLSLTRPTLAATCAPFTKARSTDPTSRETSSRNTSSHVRSRLKKEKQPTSRATSSASLLSLVRSRLKKKKKPSVLRGTSSRSVPSHAKSVENPEEEINKELTVRQSK
jgi:hypothetical protein